LSKSSETFKASKWPATKWTNYSVARVSQLLG